MITISLCMIVKNEEKVLARCLDSVRDLVDEIVIVDTGSTDATKEIASRYTSQAHDFAWIDDFSAARNASFSRATMDYILWLDADDLLLDGDRDALARLKETLDGNVDVVMMKYNYAFDEGGNVTLSFYRERLVKRSGGFVWSDPVHEFIATAPSARVLTSQICVTHGRLHHSSDRNLKIFERKLAEGVPFSARNTYYYAQELYSNGRHADAAHWFNRFLDGAEGWVEDRINACYHLAKCLEALGEREGMSRALLRSFEYATPRAEICCGLGGYYMEENDYKSAIFWYELATTLERPAGWGFFIEDQWGFVPYLQLCVCYYRIGRMDKSADWNERAALVKPANPSVLFNRKLFEKQGQLPPAPASTCTAM